MTRASWCCSIIPLLLAASASGAAITTRVYSEQQWQIRGSSLFMRCEFKKAAQTFEQGVKTYPHSGLLCYWAGKSYARLIDVSTFSSAKNARKAQHRLEEAVQLDPKNEDYVWELFDLYVYSPEFFNHGLDRAADLIQSVESPESREEMVTMLQTSRYQQRGMEEWLRRRTLSISLAASYVVPLP